jgi:hypothetical protein
MSSRLEAGSGLKAKTMRSTTTGMGSMAPIRTTRQRSVIIYSLYGIVIRIYITFCC